VSLSQEPVFSLLKSDFVCATRDITNEPWSGISGLHSTENPAVYTTNGAGPHNLQLFAIAPDGTVLHCLPGFWAAPDLATELKFAQDLNRVWMDRTLTRAEKDRKFSEMQLAHIAQHSQAMTRRSRMQGFDMKYEARVRPASSDTIRPGSTVVPGVRNVAAFKTTDEIAHERMTSRPFVPYTLFDVAAFTDYGRQKYDKKGDGGIDAPKNRRAKMAMRLRRRGF
jgi:hypothetical protein